MANLEVAQPLGGKAPIELAALSACALPQLALLELRGKPAEMDSNLLALLPREANTTLDHAGWRAARVRPDAWWLIEAPPTGRAHGVIGSATSGTGLLLIDISHSRACIRLSGAAARLTLEKGTPLDLRPNRFCPGCCATTWCAGFTVFVDVSSAAFDIYVTTSLAIAFWDWLSDAVEEFRS
jgi:heterotetrameric sarcosine oxidase gamma subunit